MPGESLDPESEEEISNDLALPEDDSSFSDHDLLVLDMMPTWQRFLKLSVERVEQLEREDRIS
jgi:hypothetical protein